MDTMMYPLRLFINVYIAFLNALLFYAILSPKMQNSINLLCGEGRLASVFLRCSFPFCSIISMRLSWVL